MISRLYIGVIWRRKFEKHDITILFGLLLFVFIVTSYFIPFGFGVGALILTLILLIVTVFRQSYKIRKELENATPREYELNGRKITIYCYTGSYVNAFYDPKSKKIYIHEELLSTLSPHERNAIIQHELGHEKQIITSSKLWWFYSVTMASWLLGGFILVLFVSYLLINILFNIIVGQFSIETLVFLIQCGILYPVVSTISLVLTSVAWIREHLADIYAAEKVGADMFAVALIKAYTIKFLKKEGKYVVVKDCIISLNNIQPLNWRSVFKELVLQTLLFRDFIKAYIEPLEKTHPPLYMRLRALKTAFS